MRRQIALGFCLLLLAGCPRGVPDEHGQINLGPNVFGDDYVSHNLYPSYAEFAVATGQLKEMEKDGYTHEQQVCFAKALVHQFPQNLQNELNDFAMGKKRLLESEYADLSDRAGKFAQDEDVVRSAVTEYRATCQAS
jgi:hypothetical protein